MNPFDVFGLKPSFQIDVAELERRYRDMQRAVHPDRHAGSPARHRQQALGHAITVNEAYRALKDDLARAHALLELIASSRPPRQDACQDSQTGRDEEAAVDPQFLLEVMELRESLADVRRSKSMPRLRELTKVVRAKQQDTMMTMQSLFEQALSEPRPTDAVMSNLRAYTGELHYYRRFLQEADAIEDELQS
jgi:molecular chaperone HscB